MVRVTKSGDTEEGEARRPEAQLLKEARKDAQRKARQDKKAGIAKGGGGGDVGGDGGSDASDVEVEETIFKAKKGKKKKAGKKAQAADDGVSEIDELRDELRAMGMTDAEVGCVARLAAEETALTPIPNPQIEQQLKVQAADGGAGAGAGAASAAAADEEDEDAELALEKKLTKKQQRRLELKKEEAAKNKDQVTRKQAQEKAKTSAKYNQYADAPAATAYVIEKPTDQGAEHASAGLHLLSVKERKQHVKKLQKARENQELPPLTPREVDALFAPPAEKPVVEELPEPGPGSSSEESSESEDEDDVDVDSLSVRELKAQLNRLHVSHADCVEKSELRSKLALHLARRRSEKSGKWN